MLGAKNTMLGAMPRGMQSQIPDPTEVREEGFQGELRSEGTTGGRGAAQGGLPLSPGGPSEISPRPAENFLDDLPAVASILRDYQRQLIGDASRAMRRHRRLCWQAPTGAGKTVIIGAVVAAAIAMGLRVLILATRTRLVRQLHERLDAYGIAHGILAASMPGYVNWGKPAQIASVDTLYRRSIADQRMPMPLADLVIFDEAHLALGASRQKILNAYPNAWIFGFTATPAKTSGASLRDQFDELILGPSVTELIATGNLVKPRVFNRPVVTASELKAVRKDSKSGDYANGELSGLMSRPKLVGDVVTNWLRIANGKRTLVFACDKGHGMSLVEQFRQAGVPCEQLTDSDDEATREEVIARLEHGVTQVVVNCFLLSYGIDIPAVECVVLARPTRSIVLYLQAVGRGMRPSAGKDVCLVIDHGRVVESLGPPAYDREWSLDDPNANKKHAEEFAKQRKQLKEKNRDCPECGCSWLVSEEGNNCPHCGWQHQVRAKVIEVQQADLGAGIEDSADWASIDRFHAEACAWYANRWPEKWQAKQNSGRWWAWIQCRKKFKRPDDERIPRRYWSSATTEPSADTAGWLKSELIRYAKSRQAA
jgi:DNA repair protein RadD